MTDCWKDYQLLAVFEKKITSLFFPDWSSLPLAVYIYQNQAYDFYMPDLNFNNCRKCRLNLCRMWDSTSNYSFIENKCQLHCRIDANMSGSCHVQTHWTRGISKTGKPVWVAAHVFFILSWWKSWFGLKSRGIENSNSWLGSVQLEVRMEIQFLWSTAFAIMNFRIWLFRSRISFTGYLLHNQILSCCEVKKATIFSGWLYYFAASISCGNFGFLEHI